MRIAYCLLLLLEALIALPGPIYGQADGVPLPLSHHGVNDVRVEEVAQGEYEIETTGSDPYVFTRPLDTALDSAQHVLSFEYFSAAGIDELQIFFVPPLDESRSLTRRLGASEGWTTFSVNLSDAAVDWGSAGDSLRIDFGSEPGRTIRVRNIQLRQPTPRERKLVVNRERRKQFEARLEKSLRAYLGTAYPDTIRRVTVQDDSVAITGSVQKGSTAVRLCEVPLYRHVTEIETCAETADIEPGSAEFTLTLDRYVEEDSDTYDRLLSRWVLAAETDTGYVPRSHARYPDDVEPAWHLPDEKPATKKGLGGYSASRSAPVSDLDSLDITSVTVNIWITQLMRSEASAETMPFAYNGKTYHVDRDRVADLDRTLRSAAGRDIVVSAIILIQQAADTPDKAIGEIFEHPDSDPAGIYSMANVTSAKGLEYYAAIMDFLARRYSRPDERYGRIHHWIAHNEVDAGWVWTNAGEKTPLLFMDLYHKSMRTLYYIARQYNPRAKVFISLTHHWNWTSDERFYLSRNLLDLLLDFSRAEGDFEWAIAHHPYPESLFEPKSWLDEKVDFSFDTPLITYKNIEVLNAWVNQPRTFYEGRRRTVYLSEQGLNSRSYDADHLREQAAGMCYAWKKLSPLNGIDAFQYHNWQDNRSEGGLRIGLRRFPDADEDPGGRKPIWHVYEALGTPREDSACAFAKDVIGIDDWDEIRYEQPIRPARRGAKSER